MSSSNNYLQRKNFTIMSQATTTELKVTTSVIGAAVSIAGFKEPGVVKVALTANATCTPSMYLQTAIDTTNFKTVTTIDSDLTTTAHTSITNITSSNLLHKYVRVMIPTLTTTSSMRFVVTGQFRNL